MKDLCAVYIHTVVAGINGGSLLPHSRPLVFFFTFSLPYFWPSWIYVQEVSSSLWVHFVCCRVHWYTFTYPGKFYFFGNRANFFLWIFWFLNCEPTVAQENCKGCPPAITISCWTRPHATRHRLGKIGSSRGPTSSSSTSGLAIPLTLITNRKLLVCSMLKRMEDMTKIYK